MLILIGAYGSLMGFITLSIAGVSVAPHRRILFHSEVLLITLLSAGVLVVFHRLEADWKLVTVLLVLIIVLPQVGSVMYSPDHPGGARVYLTPEENAGKDFTVTHTETATADHYYAITRTPNQINSPSERGTVEPAVWPILNGTVDREVQSPFLHRQVDSYRMTNGYWTITYDLSVTLDAKRNKIYSSGGSSLYMRE